MARLTFLLLLLWVGVAVSTVVDLQKRVIGGIRCERPYHVRLRIVAADGSCGLCGGSLISKRWILTAAHCFKPGSSIFAFLGKDAFARKVHITANPVIYKDKDNNKKDREHDLMLVQLPENSNIQPVALPDCGNRPGISEIVEVAGHAAIHGGPKGERESDELAALRCGNINVVDCKGLTDTLKKNSPGTYQDYIYQHWFCGQSPKVDVSQGDSGGGVVHKDKIYGLIAFTGDHKYVLKEATGFMDLCNPEYNAWIKKTIA